MGSGGGSGCEQTLSQVVHTGDHPAKRPRRRLYLQSGVPKSGPGETHGN